MEELPDEMALVVLSHIEPLRDAAAVSGTCRRWRRLMVDPHLWSLFHRRTFPTHPLATDTSASGAVAPEGGWRCAFVAAARQLKEAMAHHDDVYLASLYRYDVLPLAAARAGCLPLAQRAMSELRDAVVARVGHNKAAAALARIGYSPSRSLIDECLSRACTGGFAPMAQLFLGLGAEVSDATFTNAAVRSGNRELVALLLDHALADKRRQYPGRSVWLADREVLPQAAGTGDVELLRLLIERGATTQSLWTMAKAAQAGSVASVQLLIDHGFCFPPAPDPVFSPNYVYCGADPRMVDADLVGFGVQSGNADVVRLLCQQERSLASHHMVIALNQRKSPSMEMLQLLVPFLERHHWYACLISLALAKNEDVAVCRFLVEHGGVDINVVAVEQDGGGKTALHHALEHDSEKLARCLLACGASTDAKPEGVAITAADLARQLDDTPTSRLVMEHHAESRRRAAAPSTKRKRESLSSTA